MLEKNATINYIASVIPKKLTKAKCIEAFENIQTFLIKNRITAIMYELPNYMRVIHSVHYPKFDAFFKFYCSTVRSIISKSKLLENLLFEMNAIQFRNTSKILNPKYYHIYKYFPFTYDIGVQAYNEVLNEYDCNFRKDYWNGFWSLASFKRGELVKLYLGDTEDVEKFWIAIRKLNKHL